MERRMLWILFILINNNIADPIVETSLGTIRGVSDGGINQFMGIPYASVNASNPFGAAIPHPGFDTVFEANDDSSICPQIEEFNHTIVGDLDCLHLNVYTPAYTNTTSNLPVFVWIHGGSFNIGFSGKFMYGPKYLTRHDIILVTVNYRVGPYGFMCLDIPEVPGNQGLKDTLIALRWVHNHIQSFGGDSNKVTLGGNSAGGMAVDVHVMRKQTEEVLFNNVIMQSGNTLMMTTSVPQETNYANILASALGYDTDNVYAAIEFLANVPPLSLIEAALNLHEQIGPCIEKEFEGIEAFITENASSTVFDVDNMSIIIGVTDDELYLTSQGVSYHPSLVDSTLASAFDTQHENFIGADEVKHFYFGDHEARDETTRGVADMSSDFNVVYPIHRTIKKYFENNVKNLYFYVFAHDGERNFVKYKNNVVGGGALHADEISYLFDMEFIPEEPTSEDQLVIDKMTAMWANFIKYGDPTPETTELLDTKWEPATESSLNCMKIAPKLSIINRPFRERMAFLGLLYDVNSALVRN